MDHTTTSGFAWPVVESAVALGQVVHDLDEKGCRLSGWLDLDGVKLVVDKPSGVAPLRGIETPVVKIWCEGDSGFCDEI